MKTPISAALALSLAVLGLGTAAEKTAEHDKTAAKPVQEPFYHRFLIPGNPLDDRIREQEKLIEADPKSAALHNDLGNLLARRRFPKDARHQYEIAMKLDKKSYLPQYNIGIVYETENEISKAIRAYEKCVDLNRGFPPGLFRLGRLYERQGRQEAAVKAYAKALRIDPSMRDPARNPLVVDAELLDRASLADYDQDLASASLEADERYADESRFRHLPYDRSIDSGEVGEPPVAPAAMAPTPSAPRAPAPLPAGPGQTRPQELVPAPASAVAPPTPTPGRAGPSRVPPGVPVFEPQPPGEPLITPVPPPPTPEESEGTGTERPHSLEVSALD